MTWYKIHLSEQQLDDGHLDLIVNHFCQTYGATIEENFEIALYRAPFHGISDAQSAVLYLSPVSI
jgi:hypothetical protein